MKTILIAVAALALAVIPTKADPPNRMQLFKYTLKVYPLAVLDGQNAESLGILLLQDEQAALNAGYVDPRLEVRPVSFANPGNRFFLVAYR